MSSTCVVGLQWGDEAKGKVVDLLTPRHDAVVRFNGGANAGHTVVVGDQVYKLSQLPSGIVEPNLECVIGNGVVVNPGPLLGEIDGLIGRGLAVEGRLWISDRAHVVFPYHVEEDRLREESAGDAALGTTRRGIGPCYADKVGRTNSIRLGDLLEPKRLRDRLRPSAASRLASNYRLTLQVEEYLAKHNIVGIEGIDTRTLVLATREKGAMKGVLSTTDLDDASLVEKAKKSPGLVGRDIAKDVMPAKARKWDELTDAEWRFVPSRLKNGEKPFRVTALDFGMKWNIGRCLVEAGCDLTVAPGSAAAAEILSNKPEGVFISNGPGDPEPLDYAVKTLRKLIPETPIFGICLGHQLLGQALGAKTFKLKFGHRGANQPVLNYQTERVEITTQNHGFAIDEKSLPSDVEPTHVNLNDRTNEGLRHKTLPVFSVQYHPEASSGPHDSSYLFGEFIDAMRKRRGK